MALPEKPEKPRCRALDPGYGQQKKSRDQEERLAKRIGGRRQPGSGSLPIPAFKGDVKEDNFLFEAKRTDAKSLRIKAEWLMKIEAEAEALGKFPALSIEIGGTPLLAEKDWCLIPLSTLKILLNKEKE